jgi:hypothetical protein
VAGDDHHWEDGPFWQTFEWHPPPTPEEEIRDELRGIRHALESVQEERVPAEDDPPVEAKHGRPRKSDAEAEARLQAELVKWREHGGKPSLRSIEQRLRELGYDVSWRRVWEASLDVWPLDQRPH